jgi:hypothetical protein
MGIIFFGLKNRPIDFGEYLVKCPSCEADSWADIMISTHYFHIYFLPIFPTDKDALVICQKCGLKRSGVPFDEKLISSYKEIKYKYRHPWFTYIGVALFAFAFIAVIIGRFLPE